jgi:hypothetical protein
MHHNAALAPAHPSAPPPSQPEAVSPQANVELQLDWIGTLGNRSCPLDTVWRDPSLTRGIAGVYLIWAVRGGVPTVLYVGNSRDIGETLRAQHDDPRISANAWAGDLQVSWAAVASIYRPGVTQFLLASLSPAVVEAAPVARAISVNLPL